LLELLRRTPGVFNIAARSQSHKTPDSASSKQAAATKDAQAGKLRD
jgi:hypothetical protein